MPHGNNLELAIDTLNTAIGLIPRGPKRDQLIGNMECLAGTSRDRIAADPDYGSEVLAGFDAMKAQIGA